MKNFALYEEALKEIQDICHIAGKKGFMSGWSGNASTRVSSNEGHVIITAAGKAKGRLKNEDCLLINLKGNKLQGRGRASSESKLHTYIYEKWPNIKAILHTHPPFLQALELKLGQIKSRPNLKEELLNMPLHEATMWTGRLCVAENYYPGSEELAISAVEAVVKDIVKANEEPSLPFAIWLPGHGLCVAGLDLESCLCLTEEFEHLGRVRLLAD